MARKNPLVNPIFCTIQTVQLFCSLWTRESCSACQVASPIHQSSAHPSLIDRGVWHKQATPHHGGEVEGESGWESLALQAPSHRYEVQRYPLSVSRLFCRPLARRCSRRHAVAVTG